MPTIVQVNVTQNIAPTPNRLQQTGAFISQGGTNTSANTLSLLTQLSDLTSLLNGSIALVSLSWASTGGGQVTGSTASPHGILVGDVFTIAGTTPAAYNGTFTAIAGTTGSVIKYALTPDPGATSVLGTFTIEDVAELLSMATTFFAQGSSVPVYVLELGVGTVDQGVTALTAYLTANPNTIYAFLMPRSWDVNASFISLLASFEATTAKQYFWITTTISTYTQYTALQKCVFAQVEAPAKPSAEFTLASDFWRALHYDPSTTNKVAPFAFGYVFGVTPYPTKGNNALLTTLKSNFTNAILTGAEGGISNTAIFWGVTRDGRPFNYWYSVDWTQINIQLDLANEIINGSNDPINPLYYNQDGINRLQARAAGVLSRGVTFGMVLGTVTQTQLDGPAFASALENGQFTNQAVINAVPFVPYSLENPSDYSIGKYAGLSAVYVPARGFEQIVFNLLVSDFVSQ